jgi:N-acetylmuramoyl-L-alanine amidase
MEKHKIDTIPNKVTKPTFTVFLDAGHSGVDEKGFYKTNGKAFVHEGMTFNHTHLQPNMFCEGVYNRQLAGKLRVKLERFGIEVIDVHDNIEDTPLHERARKANELSMNRTRSLYVSLHADAFNSKARGMSVYTFKGQNQADLIASQLLLNAKARLTGKYQGFVVREDWRDGDSDHEANFAVLRKTLMPSLLIESDFFDNPEGAKLLNDNNFQNDMATIIKDSILWAVNYDVI